MTVELYQGKAIDDIGGSGVVMHPFFLHDLHDIIATQISADPSVDDQSGVSIDGQRNRDGVDRFGQS